MNYYMILINIAQLISYMSCIEISNLQTLNFFPVMAGQYFFALIVDLNLTMPIFGKMFFVTTEHILMAFSKAPLPDQFPPAH